MSVRVRGIYATALTELFLSSGFKIANPTEVILRRFSMGYTQVSEAADVTVKNLEDDPSTLLVIGFPESVRRVLEVLTNNVPDLVIRVSPIGLYAVFKGKVKGLINNECVVETPVGDGRLIGASECVEGSEDFFHVVKAPVREGEKPIVSKGPKVVGYYAIVGLGNKVTFSEHIRDRNRLKELLEISGQYVRRGYSIHWRSSARKADLMEILNELSKLVNYIDELKSKINEFKPLEVISEGELISLVTLTFTSKEVLDDIRRKVLPTTPLHHLLKSTDVFNQETCDVLDAVSNYVNLNELRNAVMKVILKKLSRCELIRLLHLKPNDTKIEIGPAKLINVDLNKGEITLKRTVVKEGIYDGLGVPKEPGDIIVTKVIWGKYFLVHEYYDKEGKCKGIYININTPPEVLARKCCINYYDLGIDIVKVGDEVKVIDVDEFCNYVRLGKISRSFIDKVSEVLKEFNLNSSTVLRDCLG